MTRRLRLFLSAATVVSLTVGVFLFISGPVKAAPYFSPPTISATVVSSTSVSVNVSNIHENTDYMYLYKDGSYWGSIWSSATVGSLTCGEHSFRVLAEDIYGSTANSNTVYATASACPAFYAPSLSGGAGGQTSINLSWNDPNTNEQGYRVYNPPYNTPIATLGANSTSYSVSGLLCGTSYSYYVQAYNTTTGQTATSNTVSPSTSACPDNSPPNAAPSSLRKTSSTTTTISLAWNDNSNNEDGFFLYRGGVKIADLGPNTTSATASGLTCNSSYSFSVTGYKRYTTVAYQENIWRKALSWLGFGYVAQAADQYIYVESSASSVTTTTSSCDTVAPSVSSLNPSAGTSYSSEGYTVSVSYTDNTGVATIQYCTSPAGQCSPSSTAATNSVSVTVSSATTYFCHRATDVVGNQSATSCATYYLRPTSPIDINATYNYSAGTVTISWWDTSTKETRFDITRSGAQSGSFTASAVSGTGFTSYTDTTKPIAGTYTYAVAACNAAGCSSAYSSNTISRPADDTTAPSGSISIQSGWATTASASNTVNVYCSDSGSGCKEYTIYQNSSSCGSGSLGTVSGSGGTGTVTLSPANSTVYASALLTDNANNSTCVSDSIFYDTLAPDGSVSINNGAATTSSQNVTLNMICLDNSGSSGDPLILSPFGNKYSFVSKMLSWFGLNNYVLAAAAPPNGIVGCQQAKVFSGSSSCSGTPVTSLSSVDGSSSTSVTLSSGYGTKYASVEFMDGAGNATCASDSILWPEPVPLPMACTSVTVTNANADADAGYTKVWPIFQCNGSSGGAVSEYRRTVYYNGSYVTQSIGTSSLTVPDYGNGSYQVYIEPHNSVGYGPATSGSVVYDTSAPSISASPQTTANAAGWYKDNVNVDLSASDSLSGIKDARYVTLTGTQLSGDCTSGGSLYYSGGSRVVWTLTYSSLGVLSLCGRDRAGNVATAGPYQYNIDRVGPIQGAFRAGTAGSLQTGNFTNSNSPVFEVDISDSLSGISSATCTLYNPDLRKAGSCGTGGVCSTTKCTGSFPEGDNNSNNIQFSINAVDNAGKSSSLIQIFTVNNQAPNIIIP